MKTRSKTKPAQSESKEDRPDLMIRAATVDIRAADGDKPAQVRMSVSSEEPVLTYIYFNEQWQRAFEILDHAPGSVDMSRCKDGLVILDRHYGDQIGLMAVDLEGRKMAGPVEFCSGQRAQEISKDAAKGLRRNVSVGYLVRADSYRLEGNKDGIPVVRAMSWTPYEASFEPVPADTTVGVNRAAQTTAAVVTAKERRMDPKEMAQLFERAAKFGISADKVSALIADGKGRAELDAMIVEKQGSDIAARDAQIKVLETRKPDAPAVQPAAVVGSPSIGLTQTEVRRYSMLRAIQGQIPNSGVDAGFERECSQEVA